MDTTVICATEPSIGQAEYLKYLQVMRTVQKPTFMLVELQLPVIDAAAVERTISFFLDRHESLRTVFPVIDNEIRQIVLPATDTRFQLEYIDVTGIDDHDFLIIRQGHFENAAAIFADIENGPLVKMFMFTRTNGYFFYMLMHHIICDEWSRAFIPQELQTIYECYLSGKEPVLPPLNISLKDYCAQQNQWLYKNKKELTDFWQQKLGAFDTMFEMTGFRKMFAGRKNEVLPENNSHTFDYAELSAILDKPDAASYISIVPDILFSEMKIMAIENRSSLSSFVYAGFFLLLYIYTGKKKILGPALMADRYQPEYQQLIGCLLGSMYLAVTINEDQAVSDFVTEINDDIIDVIVNRRLIFSHSFLQLPGDWLRNCCDIYINYFSKQENFSAEHYNIEQHEMVDAIHYPIYAQVIEYNDALVLIWKYNRCLFDQALMEDIVMCHKEMLHYMVSGTGKTLKDIASHCRKGAHNL